MSDLVLGMLIGGGLCLGMCYSAHLVFVKFSSLTRRIEALEQGVVRKAHTYSTAAGLEDALAVNLDLVRFANELELEAETLKRRAVQQAEILKMVRQGPHAYDEDRPAGKRPVAKRGETLRCAQSDKVTEG
jgi:hypothetical protein